MHKEDLEDGHEKCPVCNRLNEPGADDACEHFVGSAWDGMLMWGEGVGEFSNLWEALGGTIEETPELAAPLTAELAEAVEQQEGRAETILSPDIWELSSVDALLQLLPLEPGSRVETDGMLSGSGFSIYLRDPRNLTALNNALASVAAKNGLLGDES